MKVELTKETNKEVKKASSLLGMNKQELIRRAILVYLDGLQKMIELKHELKAWDTLSDEVLDKFERKLWTKAKFG